MAPSTKGLGKGPQSSPQKTQLTRVTRFDFEVEKALHSRGLKIRRNLLSDVLELHEPDGITAMNDDILAEIRFSLIWAQNGQEPAKDKVADAISLIGKRNSYHPVRDYLAALVWDGVPRIDTWLIDYAGATDTSLNRAIGRKILCAAVRRVRQPGCKFDQVCVLKGPQGIMKSSLVKALCFSKYWFTDQLKIGLGAKETIEISSGAWIVELAELDGMGRKESNAIKSFVSTEIDTARLAYGRYKTERARQFILFGTTNEGRFLSDLTGNRRWWVVDVIHCNVVGLSTVRDQLWAEAAALEKEELLWLNDDGLLNDAALAAKGAQDFGPWFDMLAGLIPDGSIKIAVADLWGMVGIKNDDINKVSAAHRLNLVKALSGLGFDTEVKVTRRNSKSTRCYTRGIGPWWCYGDADPPDGPVEEHLW